MLENNLKEYERIINLFYGIEKTRRSRKRH